MQLSKVEGGCGARTHDELKKDGAHAPEVGLGVVLVELQDLRRHVERASAQRLRQALQCADRVLRG